MSCIDEKKNTPTERVLEMKEAIDKTGEGQAKEILESFDSRIPITEGLLTSITTASISGAYKGVQKCIVIKHILLDKIKIQLDHFEKFRKNFKFFPSRKFKHLFDLIH